MATDCVLPQVALWGKGMVCALKRTSGLNGWISNQKHISLQSVALREGSRGFEGLKLYFSRLLLCPDTGKSKSIHNKISKFCLFMVLFI